MRDRESLNERAPGLGRVRVVHHRVGEPETDAENDWVAVEEPLELRVDGEPLVVTLRTPGADRELAAGFLVAEGVVQSPDDLVSLETCRDPLAYDPDNVIEIELAPAAAARREALERARREQVAVAACGLCGKARLEHVVRELPSVAPPRRPVDAVRITDLPPRMRGEQELFAHTGGIHAAALFTLDGDLLAVHEDIGRHNAVDKLVGSALLAGELPLRDRIVVVSARAGFEIVQKAAAAGAPILAAVGAASSLAVDVAHRVGLELWTFVRPGRANRHV
ncbi:MAG: formate dehydrogenase accessory sulfurtransferase FdhD [Acidobacteriota bacterium]